jgi:pyruvate dehydrogenase E2 component (dihydrolipoamide acetyltransferase)
MHELRMPELGGAIDEATVVDWRVAAGDRVERGDVVCVVATHEGVLDVETTAAGEVAEICAAAGRSVPVGGVLARITTGDAVPDAAEAVVEKPKVRPVSRSEQPTVPMPTAKSRLASRVEATAGARQLASQLDVDLSEVPGTGPDGQVTVEDVEVYHRRDESS